MSLQIWLPLTKDLRNLGIKDSSVTSTGATYNSTSGKLGGCYSFNGSAYLMGTQNFITNNTENWTFACWMKLNATTTGQTLFSCRSEVSANGITIFYYGSTWLIDDGVRWQFTPTVTIAANTWYHVCVVRKKGVGKYLYINGVLDSSTTTLGTPTKVNTTCYAIGMCHNGATTASGNPLNGYLNDVRFYNHALSVAEIKELAKGLVVHYKLDEFTSSDNLIVNGFGELGSENWNNGSKISTTEVPSGHSEIKSSMYDGNMTVQYIPIIQNHTYTISGYIKAISGTTGKTYPSIYGYDIDKKFIDYYKCAAGFNSTYKTTLAQPLHKGDTIVYATDLSKWTTATNNYYCHVAIFGYKNSFGDVYPDMVYTQDSPAFGTYSDKSHIDKTNNTVTLNAAFTGEDRPAGTTICQATEGSIYYYPWSGIDVSTISDWVFKTADFKPSTNTRLKAAAYIRWSTYGRCYIAGNKLVDNTFNDTMITDSSGYGNHGVRNGNITISTSTPRYEYSTVFDGSTAYIEAPGLPSETKTISVWVKTSWVTPSASLYKHIMHDKQSGLSLAWGAANGNFITYIGSAAGGTGSCIDIRTTSYSANKWNHIVVVKTGDTTRDVYVNGVKATPSANNWWGGDQNTLNIGCRHQSGSYRDFFDGRIADFRAYVTALSADDIKRLYEVSASVSKTGSMLGYEMKEGT